MKETRPWETSYRDSKARHCSQEECKVSAFHHCFLCLHPNESLDEFYNHLSGRKVFHLLSSSWAFFFPVVTHAPTVSTKLLQGSLCVGCVFFMPNVGFTNEKKMLRCLKDVYTFGVHLWSWKRQSCTVVCLSPLAKQSQAGCNKGKPTLHKTGNLIKTVAFS